MVGASCQPHPSSSSSSLLFPHRAGGGLKLGWEGGGASRALAVAPIIPKPPSPRAIQQQWHVTPDSYMRLQVDSSDGATPKPRGAGEARMRTMPMKQTTRWARGGRMGWGGVVGRGGTMRGIPQWRGRWREHEKRRAPCSGCGASRRAPWAWTTTCMLQQKPSVDGVPVPCASAPTCANRFGLARDDGRRVHDYTGGGAKSWRRSTPCPTPSHCHREEAKVWGAWAGGSAAIANISLSPSSSVLQEAKDGRIKCCPVQADPVSSHCRTLWRPGLCWLLAALHLRTISSHSTHLTITRLRGRQPVPVPSRTKTNMGGSEYLCSVPLRPPFIVSHCPALPCQHLSPITRREEAETKEIESEKRVERERERERVTGTWAWYLFLFFLPTDMWDPFRFYFLVPCKRHVDVTWDKNQVNPPHKYHVG